MILGASRAKYVEFTSRCDLRSMQRCMVNAFEYFGGVPETILTDNMKTVINRREAGQVIWNTQFADFAAEMGFVAGTDLAGRNGFTYSFRIVIPPA